MSAPTTDVFVPSTDESVAVWAEQFNEVTVIAEQPTGGAS